MPNVLSPRDLVFRPDNMDETVPHIYEFGDLPLFVVVKALPSLCCVMFHINILYLYVSANKDSYRHDSHADKWHCRISSAQPDRGVIGMIGV